VRFTAIDFETANRDPASACALGLVVVKSGAKRLAKQYLIHPGTKDFCFEAIHGISSRDVEAAPSFREVWATIRNYLVRAEFLAAHHAEFDRRVFESLFAQMAETPVPFKFLCTRKITRTLFNMPVNDLESVCQALRIPHRAHEALSDASAVARIVTLAVERFGATVVKRLVTPEIRYSSASLPEGRAKGFSSPTVTSASPARRTR
jgi:DNA polymerase-3 subunit epsilon